MVNSQEIVDYLVNAVGGGVALNLDELLEQGGYPITNALPFETLIEIDDIVFTCEVCDWTMPIDFLVELDDCIVCDECESKHCWN